MRMGSHSGPEAITGKLICARRLRVQTALQLLVFSGVIRRANVEPPRLGAEGAVALQPSEGAGNVISTSSSESGFLPGVSLF
jgi:hypothetical protein